MPNIFSLFRSRSIFTTSKAALWSRLDIIDYSLLSMDLESIDWTVNPAVAVLLHFLNPC
jgi:hypothetical protein